MKQIIYFSFGDQYSGIFQSQIIDVCRFYEQKFKINTKLISFVPYKTYTENKRKIKNKKNNAVILPMIPSRNHWYFLYALMLIPFLFSSLFSRKITISRGAWITKTLLVLKKFGFKINVTYDARGAVKAEWEEYIGQNITKNLLKEIENTERDAVLHSDHRIAVSQKLIEYWKDTYSYNSNKHQIIPCTISNSFLTPIENENLSKKLNLNLKHPIIIFSGGTDKWQSFDLIIDFMEELLSSNYYFSFLLLAKKNSTINKIIKKYPDKVECKWVRPEQVSSYLKLGDYGLLLRENSTTNRVASPTKLAEYMACGLTPIISDHIGDFSEWLINERMAIHFSNFIANKEKFAKKVSAKTKYKNVNFVKNNFLKENYETEYSNIIK
ncbi:hypothetical protein ACT29H_16540 [Thermophagus sp. OGC60D27]|uniref:hypothetical protein n=1 Tax=Thermophagus sp. OGC60D27 TaxID=3458415 RepID=UPI004037EABB